MIIVIAELQVVRWRIPVGGRRTRRAAAGRGESGESHDLLDKNRPDKPMKYSNQLTRFSSLLTIALLAGAWGILPADLHAAEPGEAQQKPVVAQRLFASPDEAVKALQAATEAKDKAALREIFGPEFKNF
jgi:L-serine deaminase